VALSTTTTTEAGFGCAGQQNIINAEAATGGSNPNNSSSKTLAGRRQFSGPQQKDDVPSGTSMATPVVAVRGSDAAN
jgi:hypothetical protein